MSAYKVASRGALAGTCPAGHLAAAPFSTRGENIVLRRQDVRPATRPTPIDMRTPKGCTKTYGQIGRHNAAFVNMYFLHSNLRLAVIPPDPTQGNIHFSPSNHKKSIILKRDSNVAMHTR